jgi:hypothetical protein
VFILRAMDSARRASKIIELAGGDTAFAKLLGLDGDRAFQQRVNNWKRRGLPSDVVLEHYETIKKLDDEVSANERCLAPRRARVSP